ncbi:MAG: PIN domain-containing protein [Nitrososphaerales archaeon]
MKVVFDTSVLVDCLRNLRNAVEAVNLVAKEEIDGFISVITEAELYAGKDCRVSSGAAAVAGLISLFTKITLDNDIAQKAAEFRRNFNVEIPDAIIAATAFLQDAKVWTKNYEDFRPVKEIAVEEPY